VNTSGEIINLFDPVTIGYVLHPIPLALMMVATALVYWLALRR